MRKIENKFNTREVELTPSTPGRGHPSLQSREGMNSPQVQSVFKNKPFLSAD